MNDKMGKVVENVIKKTESGELEWERVDNTYLRQNPFYYKHVCENDLTVDGINNYVAEYNNGYLFFSKDSEFGSAELAIQPHAKADLTVIEMGMRPQLRTLEATIREELDNPDDFIDSLLEE